MNLLPILVSVLLLSLCLPFGATAQRLEGERSLSDTPWGYALVGAPTRLGALAQRFEVRPGDCAANTGWDDCARDRERSEFRLPNMNPVQNLWVGFSLYLPRDFRTSDRVRTTVFQIHQIGGPQRMDNGRPSNPPVLQLEFQGENLRATLHVPGASNVHLPLASADSLRGRWVDFQVNLDTTGPEPRAAFWVDGLMAGTARGWTNHRPDATYVKYGIYRSFVSRQGAPMPVQVAVFDEIRLGSSRAAVMPDPARPVD